MLQNEATKTYAQDQIAANLDQMKNCANAKCKTHPILLVVIFFLVSGRRDHLIGFDHILGGLLGEEANHKIAFLVWLKGGWYDAVTA